MSCTAEQRGVQVNNVIGRPQHQSAPCLRSVANLSYWRAAAGSPPPAAAGRATVARVSQAASETIPVASQWPPALSKATKQPKSEPLLSVLPFL